MPCAGQRLDRCGSGAYLVAKGLLQQGERYLATCLDCADRERVTAFVRRQRQEVTRLATSEAARRFDALLWHDADAAEATLVPSPELSPWLLTQAERRLARARRGASPRACRGDGRAALLVSPRRPRPGASLRILGATRAPEPPTLRLENAAGELMALAPKVGGGLPHFVHATTTALPAGRYRATLHAGTTELACRWFTVGEPPAPPPQASHVWTNELGWARPWEDLYAAWLEHLFDAPEPTTWRGLHALTRDPRRNLLHDHLGYEEDSGRALPNSELEPDCADAPYLLRAYFAWKLGLPFGWHHCAPDHVAGRPRCRDWVDNESWTPSPEASPVGRVAAFFGALREEVIARSLRTPFTTEPTDLYPVALAREHLPPGTVYADPYGHTLTLVRWQAQSPAHPGRLLAVDAQPDGSLGIKRFWRGNFVFVDRRGLGGHGFKAFRPIVLVDGAPRLLGNFELTVAEGYAGFSTESAILPPAAFYDRMASLISPERLAPSVEYRELHTALLAQVQARVRAIKLGDEHVAETRGQVIPMPRAREVFGATGPWEAFSTPCRDLRLLVGIDRVLEFPAEAEHHAGADGARIRRELERDHGRWARELRFEYRRSDGSLQALTLADLIARRAALETGYNPNECPERRWGAPEGSPELSTCTRRAPPEQQRRMEELRHWFVARYACG